MRTPACVALRAGVFSCENRCPFKPLDALGQFLLHVLGSRVVIAGAARDLLDLIEAVGEVAVDMVDPRPQLDTLVIEERLQLFEPLRVNGGRGRTRLRLLQHHDAGRLRLRDAFEEAHLFGQSVDGFGIGGGVQDRLHLTHGVQRFGVIDAVEDLFHAALQLAHSVSPDFPQGSFSLAS